MKHSKIVKRKVNRQRKKEEKNQQRLKEVENKLFHLTLEEAAYNLETYFKNNSKKIEHSSNDEDEDEVPIKAQQLVNSCELM